MRSKFTTESINTTESDSVLKTVRVSMERKNPIKKNHIKEFGGRMPRRRPRDKLGTSQGHLGHLGLIYV